MMKLNAIGLLITLVFLFSCEESPTVCNNLDITCQIGTPEFQLIPNTSFEEWGFDTVNNFHYPQPVSFWVTANEAIDLFQGGASVERVEGDEAYNGQGFAAKLTTRATVAPLNQLIAVAGGAIATGQFTSELNSPISSLNFGRPFNKKIKKVSGYYKYLPMEGDSCGMYAFTRKCRTLTNECNETYATFDTISWARFSTTATVNEYQLFELELEFLTSENPDDVVIYFASSDDADDGNGGVGSTLFIDELSIEYE